MRSWPSFVKSRLSAFSITAVIVGLLIVSGLTGKGVLAGAALQATDSATSAETAASTGSAPEATAAATGAAVATEAATTEATTEATAAATEEAAATGIVPTGQAIEPGDVVDGMKFVKAAPEDIIDPFLRHASDFCKTDDKTDPTQVVVKPSTVHGICDVPLTEAIALSTNWLSADAPTLQGNWPNIKWVLSLDDRPIDLAAFGTTDYHSQQDNLPGTNGTTQVSIRAFNVMLTSLKPGVHTFQIVSTLTKEVDDGFYKNMPGTYTTILKLNIGPDNYATPCPTLKTKTIPPSTSTETGTAFLGVYGAPAACGQEILFVTPSGAAAQVFQPGDTLMAIDGVAVGSLMGNMPQLYANSDIDGLADAPISSILMNYKPGDLAKLEILRDGRDVVVDVELIARPNNPSEATPEPTKRPTPEIEVHPTLPPTTPTATLIPSTGESTPAATSAQ